MVAILMNGVDWTLRCSGVELVAKDGKKTYANIRGDALSVPPRSRTSSRTIKLAFPYLSQADYATITTLYNNGAAVPFVFTGLDLPSGSYVLAEMVVERVKSLTNIIYTVQITAIQDQACQVPEPVIPANPTTTVGTSLGL